VVLIVGRNVLLRELEALQVLLFLKSQNMRLLSNPRLWGEQVLRRMRIAAPCNAFSSAVVCGHRAPLVRVQYLKLNSALQHCNGSTRARPPDFTLLAAKTRVHPTYSVVVLYAVQRAHQLDAPAGVQAGNGAVAFLGQAGVHLRDKPVVLTLWLVVHPKTATEEGSYLT
jgi:hypothetical protein